MSRIRAKFIADKSVAPSAGDLIVWDANGDVEYTPTTPGDWLGPPTGALEALDELALRMTGVEFALSAENANFNAAFNTIYLVTGAVDVQLPAPVAGGEIKIKKTGAGTVNLVRAGSENIEGVAATYPMNSTRQSAHLLTDGTDWFIV